MRAVYRVQGAIDRQSFGLHWNQDLDVGGIVVGDKVEIDARVEVVRTAHADHARHDSADAESCGSGTALGAAAAGAVWHRRCNDRVA